MLISLIHELQLVRAAQLRSELACFGQQQEEKRSTCDQVIHFSFDSLWRHGIICCFLVVIYAQRKLEMTLRCVQAHILTMETQRVSMNENFALDNASLVKLAINTSEQCQKSVMDCAVMHSSQHNKLA